MLSENGFPYASFQTKVQGIVLQLPGNCFSRGVFKPNPQHIVLISSRNGFSHGVLKPNTQPIILMTSRKGFSHGVFKPNPNALFRNCYERVSLMLSSLALSWRKTLAVFGIFRGPPSMSSTDPNTSQS